MAAAPSTVTAGKPTLLSAMGDSDPGKIPLPPLRDDLQLLIGPRDRHGANTWVIYDPVKHRYHQLTYQAFEMLQRWDSRRIETLCQRLHSETIFTPTPDDCLALIRFLRAHGLIDLSSPRDLPGWKMQVDASRPPAWKWLLHHYLFIRVPLIRPERLLTRLWPLVRPLYSHITLWVLGLLLMLGLYLVSRQWDSFVGGFATFASWEGIVWTGITLSCAKVIHELGHAFTAHRYGCRVATMGVAFLVLMPVLYTDTSDSWRLSNHRHRLAIGIAGIAAELGLAVIATVLWSFMSDGAARNAVFIIATASWVTTLSINLSPFMRFDGYYLLSDLWGIPNLQSRAFALARWWLRESLFGFGDPMPEPWPTKTRRLLVFYSFFTWGYRFLLFLGIAVLVYNMAFKALGIFLFFVEITWFIGMPLWSEISVWYRRRGQITLKPRLIATLIGLTGLLAFVALPWKSSIPLPATLEGAEVSVIYSPQAAQVAEILAANGDQVIAGTPILRLSSPDLEAAIQKANSKVLSARLKVIQAAAVKDRAEDRLALELALDRARRQLDQLQQDQQRLTLTAAIDGLVVDMPPTLRPGLWVAEKQDLGRLVNTTQPARVVAYATDQQSLRLAPGARVVFHAAGLTGQSLEGTVSLIENVNIAALPSGYLTASQGGPIAVLANQPGSGSIYRPVDPLYRVHVALDAPLPQPYRVRSGIASVEGQGRSFLADGWRFVASVLIRESGF